MLDEILQEAGALTADQQESVLQYIRSLKHKDMRSFPRAKKKVDIDVVIDDKLIQSHSRDLSAAGVFVNTGVGARPGMPARVVLSIPGKTPPFKLKGKVVRIEEGGIAIWFNEMTAYARQALAELLKA
ncbi:MAG: PilZ domain-containing protein [Desulfobacter sp.]|nr:MAG: PilZ domain-containing protein [Desulfobacter sp.]